MIVLRRRALHGSAEYQIRPRITRTVNEGMSAIEWAGTSESNDIFDRWTADSGLSRVTGVRQCVGVVFASYFFWMGTMMAVIGNQETFAWHSVPPKKEKKF
jgi:hypothetical protein